MSAASSSNDALNLGFIKTISELDSELPNFTAIHGTHGGRRWVYKNEKNHTVCVFDFYIKLDTLVRETVSKNHGYLSDQDDRKAYRLINIFNVFHMHEYKPLNNAEQKIQKAATFCKQLFDPLLYNREDVAKRILNSLELAQKKKADYISAKKKEFNERYHGNTLENALNDLHIDRQASIGHEYLQQLAYYICSYKGKPCFVIENLKSFEIDPEIVEGKNALIDLVKKIYDEWIPAASKHFKSPNYNWNHLLASLFSTLHRCGYIESIPEIKETLLKFVNDNAGKISKDELESFGVTLELNQEIFLHCLKVGIVQSDNSSKPPSFLLNFRLLKEFRTLPHQHPGVLQLCKELLIQQPNAAKDIKNAGLDLFQEDQLQVYIELLKVCNDKQPILLDPKTIKSIVGLKGCSLQVWKVFTTIIKAISKENDVDKNIWQYIKSKKIKGVNEEEKEYLRWLTGKELKNFNLPVSQQHFLVLGLPPELQKKMIDTFHSKSIVNLLVAGLPWITQEIAWTILHKRNLSAIQHDDLRDVTNLFSPAAFIEQIKLYGSKVQELDLTEIFDSSVITRQWLENKKVHKETLKWCPHLKILKLPPRFLIVEDIVAEMPKTLEKLTVEDCFIHSSWLQKLPLTMDTLILHKVRFFKKKCPIEVPPNLRILQCDEMNFKENKMINLPNTLEEFSFGTWKSKFEELKSLLPQNLKKLGCKLLVEFTEEISQSIPSNLEVFDLKRPILKKATIPKFPPCMKTLVFNCREWDGTFNEFLECLQNSKLESLECFVSTAETNINLELLPKTLKVFSITGIHDSKLSSRMFMDKPAPENIKTFRVLNWLDPFQSLIRLLPKNIEHLEFFLSSKNFGYRFFLDEDIPHIPQSLKSLYLDPLTSMELAEEGKKQIEARGIQLILT